jgi:macrolide transport system ATP-binding/permease protein
MRVDRVYMEVVGVMPETGASMRWDPNDQILIPITTAMRRLLGKDHVDLVEVQVRERDEMEMAEAMVKRLLLRRYRLPLDEEDAFRVRNMADLQQAITETSDTMAMLLASIGIISLLVGGIGIMNIMLVSVTERTREIGVRKAIGARRGDILAQFLVEAAFVSACGGGIGILLGCGAAAAMSHFAEWTVVITAQMVLLAFGFSALVGVVFGFWPALKASSLHPIDALRYE